MGLNFLGLGFNFSAKDEGLTKFQRQADSGFSRMSGTLETLTSIAGRFTSEGMNLTTQLEAARVSSDTMARRVIANSGMMGKGFDKLAQQSVSMAEGLNMSGAETSKAVVAFQRAQPAFEKLGLSAQDLAKFSAVTGADTGHLADIVERLGKEFQITDKQGLQGFVENMIRSGEATRDVGGSVNFTKEAMKFMSRAAALGEKDVGKFGKSVMTLSAGLFQVVGNTDDARSMTLGLTEQLVSAREGMRGLFAGTQKDIPKLAEELAISSQDINKAFDLMKKGPNEFVEGFAVMVQKSVKNGVPLEKALNFIGGRLQETLDPSTLSALLNAFRNSPEALGKFTTSLSGTTGSIKEINKAFRDGRTDADRLALSEQQLISRFRDISRSKVKEFIKGATPEFRKMGETLQEMAKDNGPMGSFLKGMSEMHSLGAMSLVPESLRPMASVFATLTHEVAPLIGGFKELGLDSLSLGSALKVVLGAAGAVFFMFKKNEAEIRKTSKGIKDAVQIDAEATQMTVDQISNFLMQGLAKIEKWVDSAPGAFDKLVLIYDKVEAIIGPVISRIWKKVEPRFKAAWNDIKEWLAAEAGEAFSWAIDQAIKAASDFAGKALGRFSTYIGDKITGGIYSEVMKLKGNLLSGGAPSPMQGMSGQGVQPASTKTITPPSPVGGRDQGQVIQAVHEPAWWTEYRNLFESRMDRLEKVLSNVGSPAPERRLAPSSSGSIRGGTQSTRLQTTPAGVPVKG